MNKFLYRRSMQQTNIICLGVEQKRYLFVKKENTPKADFLMNLKDLEILIKNEILYSKTMTKYKYYFGLSLKYYPHEKAFYFNILNLFLLKIVELKQRKQSTFLIFKEVCWLMRYIQFNKINYIEILPMFVVVFGFLNFHFYAFFYYYMMISQAPPSKFIINHLLFCLQTCDDFKIYTFMFGKNTTRSQLIEYLLSHADYFNIPVVNNYKLGNKNCRKKYWIDVVLKGDSEYFLSFNDTRFVNNDCNKKVPPPARIDKRIPINYSECVFKPWQIPFNSSYSRPTQVSPFCFYDSRDINY
jgi:hypothetical protein